MMRFLSLLTFTQAGLEKIKDSPSRAARFRSAIEAAGGKVLLQCWSLGEFDACVAFEVPDEAIATAKLLELGKLGNVRTRTMRIFDEPEFAQIAAGA